MRSAVLSRTLPFYGFAVMCIDHPVVQTIVGKIEDRRIITYGEKTRRPTPGSSISLRTAAVPASRSRFAIARPMPPHEIADLVFLPMAGDAHNALNATAAIAVAHELRLSDDTIRKALASFGGVRRRFTQNRRI